MWNEQAHRGSVNSGYHSVWVYLCHGRRRALEAAYWFFFPSPVAELVITSEQFQNNHWEKPCESFKFLVSFGLICPFVDIGQCVCSWSRVCRERLNMQWLLPFLSPMTTRLKNDLDCVRIARNLSDAIGSAVPALFGKSHHCSCDDETDSIACMCYIMHTPSRKIVLLCRYARRNIFNWNIVFHR